ncbi:DUF502 domain-containing protein [Microbulbifer thermotolerans]|uniref:DUF502 domain-containing protein n=1 Tax=Microbulbifer thermotolerans TaxID=252514 RepID=UPI002248C86E|nr:DUF502 domain-containing protein [Microbulbifer thermotolerans]MCX2779673.1 DUF502 domain-containing protein [Microbulbifer thermotolerans]MCX2804896.1 DUF502 domain-containing protein [Microbulbifer thermotolerans]MCX2831741.1 DUF502 domain-containing protein [Microbulbifer thermotolerans]
MTRVKTFVTLTLLGGLAVVLPIAIFILLFQWLFGQISELVAPAVAWLEAHTDFKDTLAKLAVIVLMLGGCFVIGLLVKTSVGRWLHRHLDHWLGRLAPGYNTIKELVLQFIGGGAGEGVLSGPVARVRIHGPDHPLSVTAIVTSRHPNGDYTVYVPTAPVPTSGLVYHVPAGCVEILPEVTVEAAMKSIVACGAGSGSLLVPKERF